jgi:hypothetical protein
VLLHKKLFQTHNHQKKTQAMPTNKTKQAKAEVKVGFSTPKQQNDAPPTFSTASIPSFNSSRWCEVDLEESVTIPYNLQLAWSEE